MNTGLYIAFVLASVIVIVIPGPNVLVIISTSLSHGTRRGLQTMLGTSSAMAIQLLIAALGTSWLVEYLVRGFVWLKWAGIGYLLYLGVTHLKQLLSDPQQQPTLSAIGSYRRGFIVSLTNPKTILFFAAFLPQFATPGAEYLPQISLLSVTFLLLAMLLDGLYAVFAARLRGLLRSEHNQRYRHGLSGLLYLGAAAWLAALRKS